jgi:hypothetical protein
MSINGFYNLDISLFRTALIYAFKTIPIESSVKKVV